MAAERVDVLAVDDNPSNLLSLEAVLQDLGANLVKAHSGDEALLRVLEREFALVLLDIQMPGLDGFETARLIRSRDRCRHLPVIFLTAFEHDSEQVQRGYQLGAVDFLFKPIVPTILKSKVSVFLELHRKNAEVLRQARLLQEASRREHERSLVEARARWERERLQATNDRLQALATVGGLLLGDSDPRSFVPAVCREIAGRLGFDAGATWLQPGGGGALTPVWVQGLDAPAPATSLLVRTVVESRSPVVLQRVQQSSDALAAMGRSLGMRAGAAMPLVAEKRFLGVFAFGTRGRDTVTDDELAVLQVAADQLAIAIDRVDLVRQLQASAIELKDADRRKDEFLAMLAHELRNPLAPIVNALGLVRRSAAAKPEALRSIDAAERQALHMARLVDDLLDVSRITQGKVALRREPVDLRAVVEHAVQTSSPLLEAKRHRLEVALPGHPVRIDADATRIAQVVANLLHNAAKYTDEGGNLGLRCTVEGNVLEIAVQDDGVGIRPDMLGRVFDTFVQVDPTSDRARGGLGIGLTLVRSIADLHGGTVSAHSEGPGRGSTFTVRLPIVIEAAPAPAPGAAREEKRKMDGVARSILLVEDNEDIRLTLRDLLEFEGHEVAEAADGAAGAELIVQRRPNVALVDIGLPGMDGYQVAQRVRQDLPPSDTRLVALTGYGGDDVARKAREAGFDAHLIKPVKIEDLFRLLGELC